jgi:methylmalonyl-CoA decarboxylase
MSGQAHVPSWRTPSRALPWHRGKGNALSRALRAEIGTALDALQASRVHAVMLRAVRGAGVFSAGHDVRALPSNGRAPSPAKIRCAKRSSTPPKPVLAMIAGTVRGGACAPALACVLALAASDSTFAFPNVAGSA